MLIIGPRTLNEATKLNIGSGFNRDQKEKKEKTDFDPRPVGLWIDMALRPTGKKNG
jgi:hypothetical protein